MFCLVVWWIIHASWKEFNMIPGVYARVSDDKKKSDGERRQDVMRQVEIGLNYWMAKGFTKEQIKIYIDDGKSAFTEDLNSRPDFKRLLNDFRRHYITDLCLEDISIAKALKSLGWVSEKRYFSWAYDNKGGQVWVWIGVRWK